MTLHAVSAVVILLVAAGLWHRRTPPVHMRFMYAAFALDLALVLYIEGTRHAVETAATTVRPIVWFHAAVSLGVLALYVAQLSLGRRLQAGRPASRQRHMAFGLAFVLMRGLNFVTAFAVTGPAVPPATARLDVGPAHDPARPTLTMNNATPRGAATAGAFR